MTMHFYNRADVPSTQDNIVRRLARGTAPVDIVYSAELSYCLLLHHKCSASCCQPLVRLIITFLNKKNVTILHCVQKKKGSYVEKATSSPHALSSSDVILVFSIYFWYSCRSAPKMPGPPPFPEQLQRNTKQNSGVPGICSSIACALTHYLEKGNKRYVVQLPGRRLSNIIL